MSSEASEECLFCRIGRRQLPAEIIEETDELLAFKDVNPQAPTHLLVIPKAHISTLVELTDTHTTLMGRAMGLASRLATRFRITDGCRVVINCGPQAGQSVWHLHLHLLGGRSFRWPPG